MSFDRALALHTAALAILGAVFVGSGQEAIFIPALTALAAVTALAVTDIGGWLRLNRWLANILAIAAVGWSLREFFEIESEEKLMAIANMLCYLQVILLFQEKSARVYWQLVVLSILQVVVGAALDHGPQFGLLLAVYAVIALSTLVLLCIDREARRGAQTPTVAPVKQRPWSALLASPQLHLAPVSEAQLARSLTLPILVRQTALLTAVTLLFAIVFFYATPRLGDRSWLGGRSAGGLSGFRPEALIAERGRIHLSSHVVMRVALSRMTDRRPITLIGEPYFHGEILTDYRPDERGSRWVRWRPPLAPGSSRGQRWGLAPMAAQTNTALVRQDIALEASTSSRRFAIVPTQPLWDLALVPYGSSPRSESEAIVGPRQQRYSTATPAIRNERHVRAIPNPIFHPQREPSIADKMAHAEEQTRTLEIDSQRFSRLAETAAEVLKQYDVTEGRSLDKAIALERHFHAPGAYHYSLNLDFTRDSALDPIEDFVANHRTGHCQYFASALVLMLRSQGIPARMVIGYKGGDFNTVGNYYVVQDRHAHTWVEAWVPTDDVPEGEIAGVPNDGGFWYRLDPTPGPDSYVSISEPGVFQRLAQAFDYVELLWRDYVLSLNNNRQEDLVYDPLTAKVGFLPSWVESRGFQRWLRRFSQRFGLDFVFGSQRGNRGRPRAMDGALAALTIAGLLLLVVFIQGARLTARAFRDWLGWRGRGARCSQAPAFYRRLERLLAGIPLLRPDGQTPQELAAAAQARLIAVEGAALTARVPAEVVSAYYRVRFGGARLDKNEMQAIEQALASLAPAVCQAKKK
jgi:protein-glutamine gamma-glutamyltransferase